MQSAKNNTGNICAGNIGNAEVFFSDIGHCKAECKADNRDALGVRIAGIEPLHNGMEYKANADSNEEEKRRLDQHSADAGPLAGAGTQHTGQHDDADHIINNCGTDDGRAKEAFQVS